MCSMMELYHNCMICCVPDCIKSFIFDIFGLSLPLWFYAIVMLRVTDNNASNFVSSLIQAHARLLQHGALGVVCNFTGWNRMVVEHIWLFEKMEVKSTGDFDPGIWTVPDVQNQRVVWFHTCQVSNLYITLDKLMARHDSTRRCNCSDLSAPGHLESERIRQRIGEAECIQTPFRSHGGAILQKQTRPAIDKKMSIFLSTTTFCSCLRLPSRSCATLVHCVRSISRVRKPETLESKGSDSHRISAVSKAWTWEVTLRVRKTTRLKVDVFWKSVKRIKMLDMHKIQQ